MGPKTEQKNDHCRARTCDPLRTFECKADALTTGPSSQLDDLLQRGPQKGPMIHRSASSPKGRPTYKNPDFVLGRAEVHWIDCNQLGVLIGKFGAASCCPKRREKHKTEKGSKALQMSSDPGTCSTVVQFSNNPGEETLRASPDSEICKLVPAGSHLIPQLPR